MWLSSKLEDVAHYLPGNTVRSLVLADCSVPKKAVLRQLDDTSAVKPGRVQAGLKSFHVKKNPCARK
jgi:hypothetical protein